MGNRLSALKTVTNNALFIHSRRPEVSEQMEGLEEDEVKEGLTEEVGG